jgi:hypothetical protein
MPADIDNAWVNAMLRESEYELWKRMKAYDLRHSIEVARRFAMIYPTFNRDQVAAALLHDIGKVESELGVLGRVVATVVGPVGARFRLYHDHESIGLDLCRSAGSSDETLRLLDWSNEMSRNDPIVLLLRQADQI